MSANNDFQLVEQYAQLGVAQIQSVSPLLTYANTSASKILSGPISRGQSIRFRKQGRASVVASLTSSFDNIIDRFDNIIVDQEASSSIEVSDSQMVFDTKGDVSTDPNAMMGWKDYLGPLMAELGQYINNQAIDIFRRKTWRYFGSPSQPVTTFQQLNTAIKKMRLYGTTRGKARFFLPMDRVTQIVGNGMGDFAPVRNDAGAETWALGTQSDTDFYECTFMPQQKAGNVGNDGTILTVVSTETNAYGGVTSITLSGATAFDADAIKAGDKFTILDTPGYAKVRLIQFVGHGIISSYAQNGVVNDAGADGSGEVTIQLVEPLQASAGQLQNISNPIVAGMQLKFEPDHTVAFIMQGDPFFFAMADLMDKKGGPISSTVRDPDTGIALRLTYASQAFQPVTAWSYNALYGTGLDSDNVLAVLFPPAEVVL